MRFRFRLGCVTDSSDLTRTGTRHTRTPRGPGPGRAALSCRVGSKHNVRRVNTKCADQNIMCVFELCSCQKIVTSYDYATPILTQRHLAGPRSPHECRMRQAGILQTCGRDVLVEAGRATRRAVLELVLASATRRDEDFLTQLPWQPVRLLKTFW